MNGGKSRLAESEISTIIIPEDHMADCPDCKDGVIIAFHVSYSNGTGEFGKQLPCSRCDGRGYIPNHTIPWIEQGKKMREERKSREVTLREEAKRRDISTLELSQMERGIIRPNG